MIVSSQFNWRKKQILRVVGAKCSAPAKEGGCIAAKQVAEYIANPKQNDKSVLQQVYKGEHKDMSSIVLHEMVVQEVFGISAEELLGIPLIGNDVLPQLMAQDAHEITKAMSQEQVHMIGSHSVRRTAGNESRDIRLIVNDSRTVRNNSTNSSSGTQVTTNGKNPQGSPWMDSTVPVPNMVERHEHEGIERRVSKLEKQQAKSQNSHHGSRTVNMGGGLVAVYADPMDHPRAQREMK